MTAYPEAIAGENSPSHPQTVLGAMGISQQELDF
jgi:hypothetical protein